MKVSLFDLDDAMAPGNDAAPVEKATRLGRNRRPQSVTASLFDGIPERNQKAEDLLVEKVEKWDAQRVVSPEFSKSERANFDMWCGFMLWAFSEPVYSGKRSQEINDGVERHRGDIAIERVARVMMLLKEEREALAAVKDHEEKEKIYTAFVRRMRLEKDRMTDREVCIVMMSVSLDAPPHRWVYAEYMRAFCASFGVDKYLQVFAGEYPERLDYNSCEMLRQTNGKVAQCLPLLDKGWFARMNEVIVDGQQYWPGTKKPVAIQ